jgi:hypothetical protein
MNAPPLREEALPLALERQVDAVCARFEADWKNAADAGLRPRIEDYLEDTPEPARAVLVRELGRLEVYYRRLAGEACSPAEYEARFPRAARRPVSDASHSLSQGRPRLAPGDRGGRTGRDGL